MRSGRDCLEAIQYFNQYVENSYDLNREEFDEIKAAFGPLAASMPDDEFFWYWSDLPTLYVQGGSSAHMCDTISPHKTDFAFMLDFFANAGLPVEMYASSEIAKTSMNFHDNMRQWSY